MASRGKKEGEGGTETYASLEESTALLTAGPQRP